MAVLALLAIAFTILVETFEQLSFKMAARQADRAALWTGAGVVMHAVQLLSWFYALTLLPLSVAAPLMGATYVSVPLASKMLFREKIDLRRWIGIAAIVLGLAIISGEV